MGSLFGYFKDNSATIGAIEWIWALNISFGFIFFAV